MSFFRKLAAPFLVIFLSSALMLAQSSNATLSGFVRDASGAFIPNATVTVEAIATHQKYTTTTSESGSYAVVDLPVGDYTVSTRANGFKVSVVPKITLQTAQAAALDVMLVAGAVSEQVTVTTAVPIINSQDSSVGQVVEGKSIEAVALNGRQFWNLVALTPGATYTPGGQGTRTGGGSLRSSSVAVQINGTGFIFNGWSLDGVDITEYEQGGTNVQPNVDSLAEFKVLGANMPASYGNTPNVVAATMKSGTNSFHGTVFEFLRNDAADAHNYFARTNKNILKRHQFGGVVGGPIIKDKLFFFSDFEETRQSQGITYANIVPTDAMRKGDFSAAAKKPINPATGLRFTNDQVPISPQAAFFLKFMPTQSQANFSAPQKLLIMKGDGKVDWAMGTRDHWMARYSIADNDEQDPNAFQALGIQSLNSRAQNIALTESHTFGGKWLNEAKFGLYKDIFLFGAVLPGTNFLAGAGITGFELSQITPSFPYITLTGYTPFNGSGVNNLPKSNRIRTWQYADTVSYTSGGHEISAGVQVLHQRHTFFNGQNQEGSFSFTTNYTGDAFSDFLLGYPAAVTRAYPLDLYGSTGNWLAFFAQDNWRPRPDLTLNMGLRYEHDPFYDGLNGQANAIDYSTGKLVVPTHNGGMLINPNAQPVMPQLIPLFSDRLLSSESLHLPQSIHRTGPGVFAPRVGLAYRVGNSDKTVIRAAYGLFPIYFDSNMSLQWVKAPPFEVVQTVNTSSKTTPPFTFQNPFNGQPLVSANPNPGVACPGTTVAYLSCLQPAIWTSPIDMKHTYMHQYNLAIQHQLMNNLSLEVAYVGNNTKHNQLISTPDNVPNPGAGSIQNRRPFPQWGVFNLGNTYGSANYNALQVKAEKRYSNGFQLLGSYAWSRCLDNGSSESGPQSLGQLSRYYAPCDHNLMHVLTISSVYSFPVGHGHYFLSNATGVVNQVVSGWEIAGIYTARSGLPFTPVLSSDVANNGTSGQFPNRAPGAFAGAVGNPTPQRWFDPSVFSSPTAFTFGNSGRNILTGDGLVQLDMTLKKTFPIHEAANAEFRFEAFNVANHPTFTNPNASIGSNSAGIVNSTLNAARTLQIALKINF
ncbi:TonB-dependent receptor [Terriglobus saanensis]|uniref:Cna B domain protein n=1 Tax=Terriglobus saanensis (strain ATCC BAA-1853 / DSM 23119 / SP1PR4) TaxID=401053 RepID=E8V1S2_TERSS|nr:carboxypeptidase-like regulatory domain-containing protein [Terriglobus saanensis]ADV82353.1 Cna B domain protein [Terriglobus saanensis SP1PR4]